MKKNFLWIFIIILLSIPSILSLFNSGFFQSDDGEWMIIRFSAFHEVLRDGQFPVRFLSRLNYGYGYPVANFLYPGFMYIGEIFKVLGFGFVDTIKIIFGISMVGSAIFTYLWLSNLFNKWSSFVGSLLYLYAPYHLFDMYKRGSVGEVLALGIVPFVFWQIERKSFFWTSLGVAFLILSHNTLALLFLPVILLYLLARGLAWAVYLLPAIAVGFGLSAFFWVPAFFDLQYTVFQRIQIAEWKNYFASINLIGIVPVLILSWTLLRLKSARSRTLILMFFVGIVFLFLSLPVSWFFWELLPVSFIQFPFRLLSVTILSVAFLSAFLLGRLKGLNGFLLGIMLLAVGSISSYPQLSPSVFFDKGDFYYSTNEDTTTVKNEYLPKWVRKNPTERYGDKVEIPNSTISNLIIRPNNISFEKTSPENTTATINTIYFPGWKVFVDTEKWDFDYSNERGVIKINLPEGIRKVELNFSETPIRLVSDVISIASLLILLIVVIDRSRRLAA
ncbi:MAG: hypothetical protein Q7K55_09180 [Candidatus Levybacteria bacterium]|nr:hypothetical protein [Candidatus Levybacteria bacterium]